MLELQRNVIFGQFVDTGSVIHRVDPRFKIAAVVVMLAASFLIDDFPGFAVAFALLALVQIASRASPWATCFVAPSFFLGFLLFILFFQVLFYAGDVSEYLWRWWILSVSPEGLRYAAILGLRVVFLYYVTTMLMLTTSLVDLTNGLELIFGPLQRIRSSGQRAGPGVRHRDQVRPHLPRGDRTPRPRSDRPRCPLR